jgi:prephenate dehydratase
MKDQTGDGSNKCISAMAQVVVAVETRTCKASEGPLENRSNQQVSLILDLLLSSRITKGQGKWYIWSYSVRSGNMIMM